MYYVNNTFNLDNIRIVSNTILKRKKLPDIINLNYRNIHNTGDNLDHIQHGTDFMLYHYFALPSSSLVIKSKISFRLTSPIKAS